MKDTAYLTYTSRFFDYCISNGRDKIYKKLSKYVNLEALNTILDNGVTSDQSHAHSNFFENKYPHPERITAISNQDAKWLEDKYKGLKFVLGDGKCLPFKDNSFDLVFSSAVLEHVGNRAEQKKFISECVRVTNKYVFITTPNKWYPFEFHSAFPLIHWLPQKVFFKILRLFGKESLANVNVLNLCSKSDISSMLKELNIKQFGIYYSYFMGLPSNLLIFIEKNK